MGKIKVFSLLIFALVIGVAAIEAVYFFYLSDEPYQWDKRYMLFKESGGGPVFKNQEKILTYQENKLIHSVTYYRVKNSWIKEYEYHIPANNWGLVQTTNTYSNKPTLLLLGDSFTEGQGAYPWFEQLSASFDQSSVQLVNGGFLGTGFEQWNLLLAALLRYQLEVKYLVVLFLSDDYRRTVWNFPQNTLDCLSNYKVCIGNENFYGMPDFDDTFNFLDKMKNYREINLPQKKPDVRNIFQRYMPANFLIYSFINSQFRAHQDKELPALVHLNEKAITSMIQKYGNKVIFIHIPQKDEVKFNRMTPYGFLARDAIERQGGHLEDGFDLCKLKDSDYHPNDGHPNLIGYQKLSNCVKNAINQNWHIQ